MTKEPNQKYRVVRDDHGYACAIAEGDQWILHLNPGTEFNEKNADRIVDELNQRQDLVDHIRWTQNLWRHGIEIMRKNNLVIASDTPMEKLAFTFYSDLCEIDWRALHLFGKGPGDENYKDQSAIQAREIEPYPRPYEERIREDERERGKRILQEYELFILSKLREFRGNAKVILRSAFIDKTRQGYPTMIYRCDAVSDLEEAVDELIKSLS